MAKEPESKSDPKSKSKVTPGHPPLHRLPIVDHKGNIRGHVGKTATAATVARFLGRHGAKLGKHEGRDAWIGDTPPPPPPPMFSPGMGMGMGMPAGSGLEGGEQPMPLKGKAPFLKNAKGSVKGVV